MVSLSGKCFAYSTSKLLSLNNYQPLHYILDGNISVHALPSMNLRSTLNRAKGCHLYSLDTSRNNPSLCAAVKKKLYIYNWDGNEFMEVIQIFERFNITTSIYHFHQVKELSIADTPKALVWADQIFVGYKKEYHRTVHSCFIC